MQGVIIAAGESSRFWPMNKWHKSIAYIMGKPIIWHTAQGLANAGIKEIIIVQAPDRKIESELKKWSVKGAKIRYEIQDKPIGTGDAILRAKKWIKERFVALNAEHFDIEVYGKKIFSIKEGVALTCGKTDMPWLYGILSVKGNRVVSLVEKPEKGKEPSNLKLWGMHILTPEFLDQLEKEPRHPHSLILALSKFAQNNIVRFTELKDGEFITLKFPWHIFGVRDFIFKKYLKKKIEKGAIVAKSAILKGDVYISKGARIQEYSIIEGPCFIGQNAIIGKRNVIRGPVNIEENVHTGANMEIKNCVVESDNHFHSGYAGDSFIGASCRFGAGFISANRRIDRKNIFSVVKGEKVDTGRTYFGFACGPNVKFGVHCDTMPGVLIGADCVIGPGATVKSNLEENKILRTISKQAVEENKK